MSDDSLMRCEENVLHPAWHTQMTADEISREEELWKYLDGSFTTLYTAPMRGSRLRYYQAPGRLTAYREDRPQNKNYLFWTIERADPVIWLRPPFMALLRRRLVFNMINGGVVIECRQGKEVLRFTFGSHQFIYVVKGVVGEVDCGCSERSQCIDKGPVWEVRWPD